MNRWKFLFFTLQSQQTHVFRFSSWSTEQRKFSDLSGVLALHTDYGVMHAVRLFPSKLLFLSEQMYATCKGSDSCNLLSLIWWRCLENFKRILQQLMEIHALKVTLAARPDGHLNNRTRSLRSVSKANCLGKRSDTEMRFPPARTTPALTIDATSQPRQLAWAALFSKIRQLQTLADRQVSNSIWSPILAIVGKS